MASQVTHFPGTFSKEDSLRMTPRHVALNIFCGFASFVCAKWPRTRTPHRRSRTWWEEASKSRGIIDSQLYPTQGDASIVPSATPRMTGCLWVVTQPAFFVMEWMTVPGSIDFRIHDHFPSCRPTYSGGAGKWVRRRGSVCLSHAEMRQRVRNSP